MRSIRPIEQTAEVAFSPSESELKIECGLREDLAYVARVTATDRAGNVGTPAEADIDAWSTID